MQRLASVPIQVVLLHAESGLAKNYNTATLIW
jgi:hypothetical protein